MDLKTALLQVEAQRLLLQQDIHATWRSREPKRVKAAKLRELATRANAIEARFATLEDLKERSMPWNGHKQDRKPYLPCEV